MTNGGMGETYLTGVNILNSLKQVRGTAVKKEPLLKQTNKQTNKQTTKQTNKQTNKESKRTPTAHPMLRTCNIFQRCLSRSAIDLKLSGQVPVCPISGSHRCHHSCKQTGIAVQHRGVVWTRLCPFKAILNRGHEGQPLGPLPFERDESTGTFLDSCSKAGLQAQRSLANRI